MEISRFYEKLNKIDGNIYVVEERVELTGGVYDAPLQHDNINTSTLSVYTGPKLTGERIQTYVLSTPSLTPWKKVIRVYADVPTVYISYEAEGDTVEAEDVNRLQDEMVRTQETVNEEINRAMESEQNIAENLAEEVTRAKEVEQAVAGNLSAEISRAKGVEQELSGNLTTEITRAKAAEKTNADNLTAEITRAKAAENTLTENLSAEKTRALAAETLLESKKANVSDVNSELSNRYTKDQTYSRQEILDKIEALIGAAPKTLDTFQEVAKALGEDPNFATTIMTILSGKVDEEDGKGLSTNDYSDTEQAMLADVNNKKHTHGNKATIDKVTETLLSQWNEAYGKRHEHENKGILDTITQELLNNWNAAYTHISDAVKHVTAVERAAWNTVSDKVDTVPGKGLSTNDYTSVEKNKLAGIASGAEVNVQADWNVTDTASDAYIKSKPSSMPASDVSAWAKAASKPSYAWSEITGKPTSFTPSTHNHTKSQIADMPTKLSEFANDAGYITAADVGTGYTHPDSGVAAGTYRSVTVDKQGHVTAGSNPTTLAGYGITDAAAKNHNHDSAYMKKTGLTWNDLKGV